MCMRKLFAYSYFIGDPEQQRQFFVEGRPVVILTQAFGLIAWLCAITLLFGSNGNGHLWVLLGAPGILTSLLMTIRARSPMAAAAPARASPATRRICHFSRSSVISACRSSIAPTR